jgi:uncharacterized protein YukE
MTTPNQPGSTGGVMQNQLTMTKAAAEAFATAVGDLQQIYNQVTEANISLHGAMISESSTTWQSGTAQWTEDFNSLKGNLQNITDMLNQQVQQMMSNEANNVDLATSISSISGSVALP